MQISDGNIRVYVRQDPGKKPSKRRKKGPAPPAGPDHFEKLSVFWNIRIIARFTETRSAPAHCACGAADILSASEAGVDPHR